MKVLLLNSVCGIGSTGRICTDLYNELSKQGHDCYIAYGRGDTNNDYKTYKIGGNYNVLTHALGSRLFDSHGFYSKRVTDRFIDFINEIKPDIIHMHNIHGYYLNVPAFFRYLKSYPGKIIWTLHDCWAFSGHAAFIDFDENNLLKDTINGFRGSKDYPKAFLNNSKKILKLKKEIFTSIDSNKMLLITPSDWLKDMVEKTFLNKYKIKRIYNGIDINSFILKPSIYNNRHKYILGCANIWDARKGLDDIFYLARNLKDFQFIIVGKVKKKQFYNNITYIDRTDSVDQLVDLYNKATVFINPTYQDNFPTTNIEALACGTPVITYNTGGSSESLTREVGRIIEKGKIIALEDEIKNIEKNRFVSDLCVKRGRIFSKEKMFEVYIENYEEFIEK